MFKSLLANAISTSMINGHPILAFIMPTFLLNNKQTIEPRGNIQYTIQSNGQTSLWLMADTVRVQPLIVYFLKGEDGRLSQ
jgi:hypothetical protein